MGRVSVPFWGNALSRPLPVIALVGFYPTNKLMGDRLINRRAVKRFDLAVSCGISSSFDEVFHTNWEIPIHYSAVRNYPRVLREKITSIKNQITNKSLNTQITNLLKIVIWNLEIVWLLEFVFCNFLV